MRFEPHRRIPPVFELMLLRRWPTVADPEGGDMEPRPHP